MPREHDLTGVADKLNARLATMLSDRDLVSGLVGEHIRDVDVRTSAPRADIAVHLRRMKAFDFGRRIDARDPFVAAHRQFTPALRRDLEAVEGPLFEWLEGGADRPARFAQDAAQVVRALQHVDQAAATRVAGVLPRSAAPITQLSGLLVDRISVDTVVAPAPAVTPFDEVTKATTNADAVFELALDQLAGVLDVDMIPGIRQRASQFSFAVPIGTPAVTQQGVLSLLLEDASDPRLVLDPTSPTDTIEVTIGFPEAMMTLGTAPLSIPVPVSLGAVEVSAKLTLSAQPRSDGGGTTVSLGLVPGSITISQPAGVGSIPGASAADRQKLWDAAEAVAVQQLAAFYAFDVPLTFATELCGIGARGVTPKFRPGSSDTAPSLALFIALVDSTALPVPTDSGASLVPSGADGHLLLSNGLVRELACCLLSESEVWGGLPAQPTEETATCCRWTDIDDVTIGEESFDTLKLLEVCVDNGVNMHVILKKSGWGWDATVEITASATLRVDDGVLRVDTDTKVKVTTDIVWWLKVASVALVIAGVVVIAIDVLSGDPTAAGVGIGLGLIGLGITLWTISHLLPDEIRVPTAFDDSILDLLPGGIREKLGTLSFLTDASWDDLAIAGYMTVPNEPPLVAVGDVRLAPGQGFDLDTGEVVSAADVPARLDVDLLLHPGLDDFGMSTGTSSSGSGIAARRIGGFVRPGVDVAIRRRLAAFGSSRLVALTGRPYRTIGERDLRQVVFPTTATSVAVPGRGSSPDGVTATVLAARSSAGRLASVVVWTDATGATWLRYRTYDTRLLVTLATNHSGQSFGKPGVTDILTILNARFQAVRGGAWAWASRPPITYQWYWKGTRVDGVATIDGGARMTVVDDRCFIDTLKGVDLRGAVCVVASHVGGLSVSACSNVRHLGRIPKLPDIDEPGTPGSPGFPGGPGLPGGPPTL
ncbi:MAG TPA: hypothetical protein VNA20_05610 [Frankiaceae bacterium]|nr:hypothetical protein [Frankiaceae bacterium]